MTLRNPSPHIGLCVTCKHSQRIESSKGSVFLLCELSKSDPRFPKYPRLPMLSCSGYQAKMSDPARPPIK